MNQLLNELILEEQKTLINRNYGEHYSYKNSYKNILSIYKELKENYDIEHEVLITNTLDFFLNIAKEDFIINPEHQKFKNEVDCKLKSEFAEMERNSIRKNISSDSQKPTINRKRM